MPEQYECFFKHIKDFVIFTYKLIIDILLTLLLTYKRLNRLYIALSFKQHYQTGH